MRPDMFDCDWHCCVRRRAREEATAATASGERYAAVRQRRIVAIAVVVADASVAEHLRRRIGRR